MNGEGMHQDDSGAGQVGGAELASDRFADDLAALHRVSTLPPGDPEERLGQWLDAGAATLGSAAGVVLVGTGPSATVRAVTGSLAHRLAPGAELIDDRVQDAVARRATVAVLGGSDRTGPGLGLGTGAVVVSPLWVSGEVAGAVAFVAAPDHPPFPSWALALLDAVADGVARVLEHQADAGRLVRARSQAEAMIDLVPDPIVRLGRDGYRVDVERTPESIPFDPCAAVREAGQAEARTLDRVRASIDQALHSGALHTTTFATGADPLARRVEARFVPAGRDEVLCIVRDITDRHRAEQALAEQVAFEALVTSISMRLIGCDPADLDDAIVVGLGEIAAFFAADTAFIDELSADRTTLRPSLAWSRAGAASVRRRARRVDSVGSSPLVARLDQAGHVFARAANRGPGSPDAGVTVGVEVADLADPEDRGALWVRLGAGTDLSGVVGLTWRDHEPPLGDDVLGLVRFAADAFHGAIRRRSVALLAQGQASVFESIARSEPVTTALLGARDLLARNAPGSEVVVLIVDGDRLDLITEDPDHPWEAWFGALPLDLTNPYGQAVATGEPVAVVDSRSDPRFGPAVAPDPSVKSVAVHPVRSSRDGRTLAVVAVMGEAETATTTDPLVRASVLSLVAVALEREADTRQLAHQATHDPLTGVGNRAALVDRLSVVLARARRTGLPVAVLFCDLDGFKAVNDRYGHDRGDRLLVEVANRIRRAVRPSDTVSRTGGDEFVVVCEDLATTDQADLIVERVYDAVEGTPVRAGEVVLDVKVSIGVALADPVLDDPDRLLRSADLAMYETKERSRATRRALALPGADRDDPRRSATTAETDLRRAIAEGGLELHHQPLVGRDGMLVGVEALVRWDHPDHGHFGPERIVATAAGIGLTVDLGRWVRRRAFADRTRWAAEGHVSARTPVHVNVDGSELTHPGFVDSLTADLRFAAVEPGELVLEIREAHLCATEARDALAELARLDLAVVVDGVGQDGLPLTELVSLPIRGVKLAPALVGRLDADQSAVEAARSLVLLAHGLGWKSLAVGVETDRQRSVLFGFGIDAVQGRAVAVASDADSLRGWLGARRDALP